MKLLYCYKCKQHRPKDYFWKDKTTTTGYCNKCKDCQIKAQRKQQKRRGYLYARKWSLKTRYGLTLEEYEGMFRKQNGVCAICEKANLDGTPLCIDHDHKTKKVRKLLCRWCNRMIGLANEDISVLNKSIDYLDSFRDKSIM